MTPEHRQIEGSKDTVSELPGDEAPLTHAEAPPENPSGFGSYRIQEPLGAGGMGTVYRAVDERLGRSVAIKVTKAPYSERFQREARAISALNHPNICTLYDVGPNYLVMELLDGPTLAEEIRRGPVALAAALRFGAQIAAALAEAHGQGIVHRDLKPGNVVLTRHGVKVLDFGLAKVVSDTDLTKTSAILGTPPYMAPEQTQGEEADSRADLFALGLVLYEMIKGKLPFPGASLGNMLASGAEVSIEPPCKAGTSVAARLNTLILGLLERDPKRRTQSAAAVREELLALAALKHQHGPSKPVMAAVVTGVLALTAAAVWWSSRSGTPAQRWPEVSRVSLVTTYPGDETTPAVSADGEWVAFSWQGESGGHRDIYVTRSDGAEQPRRLTHDPSEDTADAFPAWSPDGREIAFVRRRGGTAGEIFVIPADGGEERHLLDIRLLFFPASSWLAFTPDGGQIVFASASLETGRSTLFSMRLADAKVSNLIATPDGVIGDASPALSPDGRSLAFLRWSSPTVSTLLVQAIGTDGEPRGEPSTVPGTGVAGGSPTALTWAGDRQLFFAERQRILEWEPGANPEQVYLSSSQLTGLAIAGRDAKGVPRLIAAQRNRPAPQIWKISLRSAGSADGSPALLSELGNDVAYPDYSPDGEHLALISGGRSGNPEVWIADADGSNLRQLTRTGLKSLSVPRWSPDNRHIAFFARQGTEPQIYVIDATGEQAVPRQLTDEVPGCNIPTWSGDGKFVYCSRRIGGEMRLYRVAVESSQAGPTEMERWFEGKDAKETSDGRILYVKDDRPGLFARSLAGDPTANTEERLVSDIRGPIAYFSPVAEGIYYRSQDPSGNYVGLRFYDYERHESSEVMSAAITGPVGSLTVSPDGHSLLYSRAGAAEIDLALIQF